VRPNEPHTAMRPIREYDAVRVIQLLKESREFIGTKPMARAPRIGDVAIVCHEYAPSDPTAVLAVELVDHVGCTIWLADLEREELALVP
jgi:hypothetical protein